MCEDYVELINPLFIHSKVLKQPTNNRLLSLIQLIIPKCAD